MNRHIPIIAVLLGGALLFPAGTVGAKTSVVYSKHNLSKSGPGEIKALTEDRICVFCHAPHNANPLTPLWNKNIAGVNYLLYTAYTSSTMRSPASPTGPTGATRLCLSCHDGTIALGQVLQPAGRIAMTPVVERAPTRAAPRVTAAHVSRPTGSAMTFSFGSFGSCLRTVGAWTSLVMTRMFLSGTSGRTRSRACCRNDRSPSSVMSCLGVFSRLTGQKRSPRPPAMMMTKRSLVLGLAFILFHWVQTRWTPRRGVPAL